MLAPSGKRTCWAKILGDCSGPLTNEHVFTRALFEARNVPVAGPAFLNGATEWQSIDNLTAKALCKRHNGGLSPVDDAAIDFVCALRERVRLLRARLRADVGLGRRRKWPRITLPVDGARLERWCLKTTINCARANHQGLVGWTPPPSMISAAFGVATLPVGVGLGVLTEKLDDDENEDPQMPRPISFGVLKREGEVGLGGSIFRVGGVTLVCTWERTVASVPVARGRRVATAQWHGSAQEVGDVNVALKFDWSGRAIGSRARVKLREHHQALPR